MNQRPTDQHAEERLWGILAEYANTESLLRAAEAVSSDGYQTVEAYTPFPVDGLSETLGQSRSRLPWVILTGGILGGTSMYGLQYWINLYAYPLNIGGRPLHSWPSFIPPTFELTVLTASFFALFGVVYVCRLPKLHHPLFEIEDFKRGSHDAFFLVVRDDDVQTDCNKIKNRLRGLGATSLWEVPDV